MSLKERLVSDMKEAMKAKAKDKLNVIRMVNSKIKNAEIEAKSELQDGDVLKVIAKEIKETRETLERFLERGDTDAVNDLKQNIELLQGYLPKQMSEDEVRAEIHAAIKELGIESAAQKGKLMGPLMKRLAGKTEGTLINKLASEELAKL